MYVVDAKVWWHRTNVNRWSMVVVDSVCRSACFHAVYLTQIKTSIPWSFKYLSIFNKYILLSDLHHPQRYTILLEKKILYSSVINGCPLILELPYVPLFVTPLPVKTSQCLNSSPIKANIFKYLLACILTLWDSYSQTSRSIQTTHLQNISIYNITHHLIPRAWLNTSQH